MWALLLLALTACPGSGEESKAGPRRADLTNELAGVTVHDGWAPGEQTLWLVGERTGDGGGVVLRSIDGGSSFQTAASIDEAAALRTMLFGAGGIWWIGGNTRDGTGLIMSSADEGRTWTRNEMPGDVEEVTAITRTGESLVVAGVARPGGVILTRNGDAWLRTNVAPRGDGIVFLESIAAAGRFVVAAGGEGSRAVVLVSRDAGRSFRREGAFDSITGANVAAFEGPAPTVGGYVGETDATKGGVLIRRRVDGRWDQMSLPRAVDVNDVAWADDRRGAIALATGVHDRVYVTADKGKTWSEAALEAGRTPATIEFLVIGPGGALYAIGSSGVYRTSLPARAA